jgi:hypothetical protein
MSAVVRTAGTLAPTHELCLNHDDNRPDCVKLENPMKVQNLAAALMTAGLLMAAPAFAQTTPAQKQPTQEGGASGTPCNLVANPASDPDCKNFKQKTQSLTPPVNEVAPKSAGK